MCAECGMNPCHPRCPNAPEPVPVHECVKCGYGILAGDKFWDSPEGKICEEYERKTIDTWELQLNYGYGWEYTLTEFTREEARARLKEYRENQPQYPARLVKKRVRKEEVA